VCGRLLKNTGVSEFEFDIGVHSVGSYAACCSLCAADQNCTQWAWHAELPGSLCHLHSAQAKVYPGKEGCFAGVMNGTGL
jgi:hypothetical protein